MTKTNPERVWKISTAILAGALALSWITFGFKDMIRGDAMDIVRSQQNEIRQLKEATTTLQLYIDDLRLRDRQFSDRLEMINTQRVRDYEFLSGQINRAPIKNIR